MDIDAIAKEIFMSEHCYPPGDSEKDRWALIRIARPIREAWEAAARARVGAESITEDVLSFLDGVAENGKPGNRKPLNPIITGLMAETLASQLRSAVGADVRAGQTLLENSAVSSKV